MIWTGFDASVINAPFEGLFCGVKMARLKLKYLSAAVVGLIMAGAPSVKILDQYLDEREGNVNNSYQDAGGIWTVCRGITYIGNQRVTKGMKFTNAQCDALNAKQSKEAIDWVNRNVSVPLTGVQQVGVASFCKINIGPGKCRGTKFWRLLNAGKIQESCDALKQWVWDGGKDCRLTKGQKNGCYGQVERRNGEAELICSGY